MAWYAYHIADASGTRLICRSPEGVRSRLHEGESWPPGQYTVFMGPWTVSPSDTGTRWGIAIKYADGPVELIPDPPA